MSFQDSNIPLDLEKPLGGNRGFSKFEGGVSTLTTQTKIYIHNLSAELRDVIESYIDPSFLKSIGIDSFVSDENIYYDLTEIKVTPKQIKKLTDLYNRLISEQKGTLNSIRGEIGIKSIQILYKRLLEKNNAVCILGNGFTSEKTIKLYMQTKGGKKAIKELGFRMPFGENYEYNINSRLPRLKIDSSNKENRILFAIREILKNEPLKIRITQNIHKATRNTDPIYDTALVRITLGELLSQ